MENKQFKYIDDKGPDYRGAIVDERGSVVVRAAENARKVIAKVEGRE